MDEEAIEVIKNLLEKTLDECEFHQDSEGGWCGEVYLLKEDVEEKMLDLIVNKILR